MNWQNIYAIHVRQKINSSIIFKYTFWSEFILKTSDMLWYAGYLLVTSLGFFPVYV